MTQVFVGIGSNLDDPRQHVLAAFEDLARLPETAVRKRSSLYRTAPLGHANQPDFFNAVAELDSALAAAALLSRLQDIEMRHGRQRSFANAPRTLDLDLLLFNRQKIQSPALSIPHPRMHERAFVLAPLLEIAPDVAIPGRGPARECLAALAGQKVDRLVG